MLGRLVPPSYIRSAARCDVTRCDVRRRHGDTRTHVFHAKRSAGAWMSSRRFFDDYTPVNRMHHSERPFFLENLTACFASALDTFCVSSTQQLEDIGLVSVQRINLRKDLFPKRLKHWSRIEIANITFKRVCSIGLASLKTSISCDNKELFYQLYPRPKRLRPLILFTVMWWWPWPLWAWLNVAGSAVKSVMIVR